MSLQRLYTTSLTYLEKSQIFTGKQVVSCIFADLLVQVVSIKWQTSEKCLQGSLEKEAGSVKLFIQLFKKIPNVLSKIQQELQTHGTLR